ncbi:uncharacterized protein LOC110708390 [Chenopodium quinoa]|uniref:uncharacterized protein LOC110708390 n=1 Tax=Chenopodium quinoa TaxID=63459 RepID=UPI000B7993F8|nr:uncharacterized protein LOC110708390 [Chenopodium quinoa]
MLLRQSGTASVLVMQIWMQERMKLIEQPLELSSYRPKGLTQRRILQQRNSFEEWRSYMSHGGLSIRWVIPWWFLKSMLGVQENVAFIWLFGIRNTTYVFSWRIMRQYGMRQIIPTMDTVPQPPLEVRVGSISAWYEYMVKLPHWVITIDRNPLVISKHYVAWMIATTSEERLTARRAEATAMTGPTAKVVPTVAKPNVPAGGNSSATGKWQKRPNVQSKKQGKVAKAHDDPTEPPGFESKPVQVQRPMLRGSNNTWVRTEAVKPSKFDRHKDDGASSLSIPANEDGKINDNDGAMAG